MIWSARTARAASTWSWGMAGLLPWGAFEAAGQADDDQPTGAGGAGGGKLVRLVAIEDGNALPSRPRIVADARPHDARARFCGRVTFGRPTSRVCPWRCVQRAGRRRAR